MSRSVDELWLECVNFRYVCLLLGGQVKLFHGAFPPTGTGRATFHRREVDKVLCVRVCVRISYTPRRTFTHRGAGEFMEDFCGSVNATRVFLRPGARFLKEN